MRPLALRRRLREARRVEARSDRSASGRSASGDTVAAALLLAIVCGGTGLIMADFSFLIAVISGGFGAAAGIWFAEG
jgi:hypothetical protein